jgi:hypothetical protein
MAAGGFPRLEDEGGVAQPERVSVNEILIRPTQQPV